MSENTGVQFTDSIEENLTLITELIGSLPPGAFGRAKRAAVQVENLWNAIQKDNPRDTAVALGTMYAIYTLAQRSVGQQNSGGENGSRIQLLS